MPKYLYSVENYFRIKAPVPLADLFEGGPGEWRATCPFCKHPSQKFFINKQKGLWQCKNCPAGTSGSKGGGILTYHSLTKPCPIEEARKELLLSEYAEPTQTYSEVFISSTVVEGFQKALALNVPAQLAIKHNWKFSQEAIDYFKLGFNASAITIPVYDTQGRCINIRHKKVFPTPDYDGPKIWSYRDEKNISYGTRSLFPVKNLEKEELFIVAGEKDLISSWSMGLRNIITSTGGESNWDDLWSFDFHGKTIYIVYDIDEAGLNGAKELYRRLQNVCNVHVITLPEMPPFEDGSRRKDLTDFWNLGKNLDDFVKLVPSTNYFVSSNGHHPVVYNYTLPTLFSDSDRDYLDRAGSRTVLDSYIEFSRSRVNSPSSYHRLSGLWVLSNVIGYHGYSHVNDDIVFPNLWCLLVGPSTTMMKTATTKVAKNILHRVMPNAVAMTNFSPEGAMRILNERQNEPTTAIYYDEIAMLFEQIRNKDFMSDARDLLIKMQNNEELSYQRSKDGLRIKKSYTTLIGSGVGKRLAELLMWKDVDSGFLVRFLMALETEADPYEDEHYMTPEEEWMQRKLIYRLQQIKERWETEWEINLDESAVLRPDQSKPYDSAYRFRMNGQALNRYLQFARTIKTDPTLLEHEHIRLVHARLPMFLQKLMVIYAASDKNTKVMWNHAEVNLRHVLLAIRDLDFYRRHMVDLILHIGASPIEHFITESYTFIYENRRVTRQHLARHIKTEKRTLDSVIETMLDRGLIVRRKLGGMEEFMVSVN